MPQTKTLRNILNKADVPEFYDNHELYYSDPIAPTPNSPKYLLRRIYCFHIVKPRNYFLKWSDDKYQPDEYEMVNISVPWQVLSYTYRWNTSGRYYAFSHTKFLAFSHTNILDVPSFEQLETRKEHLFPAYLPNLSAAGTMCFGSNENDILVYEGDHNLYESKESFRPNFKTHLFESSISLFDAFFNGICNRDYDSFEYGEEEDPDDYMEEGSSEFTNYSNWFNPDWTVEHVTEQKFLKFKRGLRYADAMHDWDYNVIKNPDWDYMLSDTQ